MKKEEITTMGVAELKKKYRTLKYTTGILIGCVLVMFGAAFMPTQNEVSFVTKLLPFSFLPLVIIQLLNKKKLKQELKSREETTM